MIANNVIKNTHHKIIIIASCIYEKNIISVILAIKAIKAIKLSKL